MLHRRKGRKIYTYRVKNRRVFSKNHPMRSAFGLILTLVLAAFAGIVGYSVIAPVYERLTAEAQSPTTVPEPFDASAVADSVSGLTQTSKTSVSAEMTMQTTTTTTATQLSFDEDTMLIYCVSEDDMTDLSALEQTAVSASNLGYTALAFPLKIVGGTLTYASAVDAANISGATQEDYLTLAQITDLANENGLECMAFFDMLNDQTYPAVYQDGAYTIADSGLRWLDMSFEGGGKPWMSPFSPQAQSYLLSLAEEISNSGFTKLFCTDLIFPNFYDSDVSYIGDSVSNPAQRANALASVLNGIAESVSGTVYTFDFMEAVNGSVEVLDSDSLNADTFCVRFDLTAETDSFSWNETSYVFTGITASEKSAELFQIAKEISGERTLYPCVVKSSMTDEELSAVLKVFYDAGCRTILVSET